MIDSLCICVAFFIHPLKISTGIFPCPVEAPPWGKEHQPMPWAFCVCKDGSWHCKVSILTGKDQHWLTAQITYSWIFCYALQAKMLLVCPEKSILHRDDGCSGGGRAEELCWSQTKTATRRQPSLVNRRSLTFCQPGFLRIYWYKQISTFCLQSHP